MISNSNWDASRLLAFTQMHQPETRNRNDSFLTDHEASLLILPSEQTEQVNDPPFDRMQAKNLFAQQQVSIF
jgi:hypothetical protein